MGEVVKPASQRSRHLGPGDKLGKYEVIRQIAIGGMAELYLARTSGIEGFEKLVVLKRILPQYVSNTNFINMFLNEARIAATLHHGNIAQVYDIGVEDGDYFFAMEYVHGEDLDHILIAAEEQGVPVSLDAALTLVAGLCAGLHYAHERSGVDGKPLQIVHRDVSPSNVLVSYDGSVKLVDFGIARATSRASTTHGGGIKGKIAYMSPEQCKAGGQLDRRSDIYAVGTILYELSTGQQPFTGETEYQVLNQIVNDDAPPPSRIVPSYPPVLERIVLRALARDPDQRYPTALALQTDVEDFAHEVRLRISPLVLARLMGSLFPARLEEWDHAKSQGAFFVEQHVVRTLIESGKTPDPEARAELAAAMAAEQAAREALAVGDDETTAITQTPQVDDADTTVGAPPLESGQVPPMAEHHIISTPTEPKQPTPYPAATPGSLVTSMNSYGAPVQKVAVVGDVTERVYVPKRQPRYSSPTAFVRTGGRSALYVIVPSLLVAAGIAAVIVVLSMRETDPSAAVEVEPAPAPEPKVETVVAPPPAEPAANVEAPKAPEPPAPEPPKVEPPAPEPPKVETAKAPEPAKVETAKAPEPAKVETAKAEPKKAEPKPKPKKIVKKAKRPEPKAEPKPKEDPAWDADSPFMPVREKR